MSVPQFDQYSRNYDEEMQSNVGKVCNDLNYLVEYKVEITKTILPRSPEHILEFGCGVGRNLSTLHRFFPDAEITGCDISAASLDEAAKVAPFANYVVSASPESLLRWNDHFDLIFIANVFHHIALDERLSWARALKGALRKRVGALVVFEQNPWNPATRYFVNTCPFDKDAKLLSMRHMKKLIAQSGLTTKHSEYTLLWPKKSLLVGWLERHLALFPFGGQYFILAHSEI